MKRNKENAFSKFEEEVKEVTQSIVRQVEALQKNTNEIKQVLNNPKYIYEGEVPISRRNKQILSLIQGVYRTPKQISEELGLSESTVKVELRYLETLNLVRTFKRGKEIWWTAEVKR